MECLPCTRHFDNHVTQFISFNNGKNKGEVQLLSPFYRKRYKGFKSLVVMWQGLIKTELGLRPLAI